MHLTRTVLLVTHVSAESWAVSRLSVSISPFGPILSVPRRFGDALTLCTSLPLAPLALTLIACAPFLWTLSLQELLHHILEVVLLFSSGGFIGLPTAQASVRRPTRGVAGVSVSARVGGYGAVTVDERVAAAATVQVIRMLTSVL